MYLNTCFSLSPIDFQHRKWNYRNWKWNYFFRFQAFDKFFHFYKMFLIFTQELKKMSKKEMELFLPLLPWIKILLIFTKELYKEFKTGN